MPKARQKTASVTIASPRSQKRLPLLPLKDVVLFPRMVVPLLIGRPASINAVEESLSSGRPLFLCTQRDNELEEPRKDDLYKMGVIGKVLQTLRMPDGTMKIVVEGLARGSLQSFVDVKTHSEVHVKEPRGAERRSKAAMALMRFVGDQLEEYIRLGQRIAPEVAMSLSNVDDPGELSDLMCAHIPLRVEERQELLEIAGAKRRLERISEILNRENELLSIEQKVRNRLRDQMERGQREYYLHEQIRAIQQELGDREGFVDEFTEMRNMMDKAKMPKVVREKAERELQRYERMPPMSPEGAVIRTYFEWLTDMPWSKRTRDRIDLEKAKRVLDEDHYGLTKVKERILEYLAVRKLSKSPSGPALCLIGPPGVGKTSLGKSIARAMGRQFVRVSLGGIRDEAEIRGHRRTYIGSLPGRIVQSIKKSGVKNPVFMLDEIDKMSVDFRGDPSSALLEVLDPEQNSTFSDHYLEVDFDLHEVFFITTANNEYDIPEPLLDRMEQVRLSGYTPREKEEIAKLFLIPKQMKQCGLTDKDIEFHHKGLDFIIHRYTEEAGVRELERQIRAVCRKVTHKVVSADKRPKRVVVTDKVVMKLLGPPFYSDIVSVKSSAVGVSVGLAWTVTGGDILIIETTVTRGKGVLTLTGQLGEVMQESAQAAYTYLRAEAKRLKIPTEFWKNSDVHVHIPEGAIPKDGPSAGVAMAISMLSALKKKAPNPGIAMTGEITLRGNILTVGGVKEKILAGHRAGTKTLIMPKENEKDLHEIPKDVSRDLNFVFVEHIDEVIRAAFSRPRKKS